MKLTRVVILIAQDRIIVGADILPQFIAAKNPHYAVCVYDANKKEIIESFEKVSFNKLINIVNKTQAQYLASDNIYELVSKPSQIPFLAIQLAPTSKLLQITGSPVHGFTSLTKLLRQQGFEVRGKLNPLETAEACVRLAEKRVGYILEPFENETKIIITRTRSKGAGGWSQARYGRLFDSSVLQVSNEIESTLKDLKLDYDKHARKTKYGAKKVVFSVYEPLAKVARVIKNKKGELCQVSVVPIRKEHIEFIPLSQEIAIKPKLKRLIVGIDPGLTVGLSIMNLNGKVLSITSIRQATRGEVIREITKFGRPSLICCDVYPYPSYVEKIAANLNGKLYAPKGAFLTIAEKNRIARQLAMEQGIIIKDAHQRDSLSAAYSGYKHYRNEFKKVDERYYNEFGSTLRDELKDLLIRGKSLSDAVQTLRTQIEEEKKRLNIVVHDRKKQVIEKQEFVLDPSVLQDEVNVLREKVETYENLLKLEKEHYNEIFIENKELEREIDYLKNKLAEGKSKYIKNLYKEKIFLQKDNMINYLREKNKILQAELSYYKEKVEELKKFALLRGREGWIGIKVIRKFTQEEISKTEELYGLNTGDIVYLMDCTGGGGQTAELLLNYKIKAIIGNIDNFSYYAKKKFIEHAIPLIDISEVKDLIRMDEIAMTKEETLLPLLNKAKKEIDQIITEEKESFLEKLVESYRKERKLEFSVDNKNEEKEDRRTNS